jgi:hypothetical protein
MGHGARNAGAEAYVHVGLDPMFAAHRLDK